MMIEIFTRAINPSLSSSILKRGACSKRLNWKTHIAWTALLFHQILIQAHANNKIEISSMAGVPPGLIDSPTGRLATTNADFSLDLYRALGTSDSNRNLFFSPGSISVALAMTYLGAQGNTAAEMRKVLKFGEKDDTAIHQSFAELLQAYQKAGSVTLNMANRLFAEQSYNFVQKYLENSQSHYSADLAQVDFVKDFEGARNMINAWVSEKTAEKIKDILPAGSVDALTRMVLVNAVYFKGDWKLKFKVDITKPGEFTSLDGSKTTVPMMYQKSKFSFGVHQGLHAQAIELPYAGESMSFIVMLPTAGKFDEFEKNLKLEDVVSCEKSFRMMPGKEVQLFLPRFRMEDSFSLTDTLSSLGIRDLFSEGVANLSGIDASNNLFVSKVLHKAFLEVNEEGSEAAAATAVVMQLRMMPKTFEFRCDRPFFFFIRENTTRSILFMGRMMKPNVHQSKEEL